MASSWFSHIWILLSILSVVFYRSDLGTTAISKIYFSKSEQVNVCVNSVTNLSLHCTKKMDHILTPMFMVHQFLSPKTVVPVRTKAGFKFCYSLWVWPQPWHFFRATQGLDPSLQLEAKHYCPASKGSASLSWNWKGAPAWAAVASGNREISVHETGFYLCSVIHHNTLHPHLFYARLVLFRKQLGYQIWCSCPSVQSEMHDPMKTKW